MLIGLYSAQLVLPQQMKPGYVAGTMAGSETVGHLQTSGDEQISYDTRSQAATGAVQISTQAMSGATDLANSADVACGVSRMGAQVAAKQRPAWDARNSTAEWWYELLRDVGDATCGVGGNVRGAMTEELTSTARQSSILSARVSSPAPTVRRVEIATHQYTPDELNHIKVYAATLPAGVQAQLIGDLPQDAWNVYGDRVRAYIATH